jgi:hypothetical protein
VEAFALVVTVVVESAAVVVHVELVPVPIDVALGVESRRLSMSLRIYVASSWRNQGQPSVINALRCDGHQVYDFREPAPGLGGFAWSEIDPDWQSWSPQQMAQALKHPIARQGFALDMAALALCDACVLVMPCGRSAHLELGYAIGAGKWTAVLQEASAEPELMYAACALITTSLNELRASLLHRGGL